MNEKKEELEKRSKVISEKLGIVWCRDANSEKSILGFDVPKVTLDSFKLGINPRDIVKRRTEALYRQVVINGNNIEPSAKAFIYNKEKDMYAVPSGAHIFIVEINEYKKTKVYGTLMNPEYHDWSREIDRYKGFVYGFIMNYNRGTTDLELAIAYDTWIGYLMRGVTGTKYSKTKALDEIMNFIECIDDREVDTIRKQVINKRSLNNSLNPEQRKNALDNMLNEDGIREIINPKNESKKPKVVDKNISKKNQTVGSILKTINGSEDDKKQYNGFVEFQKEFDRWYNVLEVQNIEDTNDEIRYESGINNLKAKIEEIMNWAIVRNNQIKKL